MCVCRSHAENTIDDPCRPQVNQRLADELRDETQERVRSLAEFSKIQWPTAAACKLCKGVVHVPHPALGTDGALSARAYVKPQVLRHLHRSYCLETSFECWVDEEEAGWGVEGAQATLWRGIGWLALAAGCFFWCTGWRACRRSRGGGGYGKRS